MLPFSRLPPMRGGGVATSKPVTAPEAVSSGLAALIPPRVTPHGPLHVREGAPFACAPLEASSVEAVSLSDESLDLRRPLFLDTETTGLAGGTGTLPFLIGVARKDERTGEMRIEQAHLPAPGQERPMLHWLREALEAATVVITFNGKSFDWPLLRSRFVMNRLPPPPELPHVDLLHCARRAFRFVLEQTPMSAVERAVLGVERQGDIDGALIPAVWFDYLRTRRVAGLSRVLEHNERDVRSMVELVEWLAHAWEGRRETAAEVRIALALVAARRGDDARALEWVREVVHASGAAASAGLELKAALLRKQGDVRGAVECLRSALDATPARARLHLKLAKLYEHQLKDPRRALEHAPHAREAEPVVTHSRRLQRLSARAESPEVS